MISFILSSKNIAEELIIDFGELTPTQLPLENKILFDFQSGELNTISEKIYLTSNSKIKTNCDVEHELLIIENNTDLLKLILKILRNFRNKDILFLYGDTLIRYPKLSFKNSYIFTVDNVRIPYHNWHKFNDHSIMAGSFYLKKELTKEILKNKFNSIGSFLDYIKLNTNNVKLSEDKWFDFGQYHTFYNSRKSFLETREFNNIKVVEDGFIEKSSKNISKLIYEYNWLKRAYRLFPNIIPHVKKLNIRDNNKVSYCIEYVNLPNLSDIFVRGNHREEMKKEIISNLISYLKKIQNLQLKEHDKHNFILDKLIEREKKIIDISASFSQAEKIKFLISKQKKFFRDKKFKKVIMHGDYCFSNILYDMRLHTFKLVDPRGYTSVKVGFEFYGPYVYDYFKLAHSYVGMYDNIMNGDSPKEFNNSEIVDKLDYFSEKAGISKQTIIYGIMNLFLTMLPLHGDNSQRQKSFIEMAIKLEEIL